MILAATGGASVGMPVQLGALALRREVTIDRPELRLSDVADLSILRADLRARAQLLRIARFRGSSSTMIVSDWQMNAQLRAKMPVLAGWLPQPSGMPTKVSYRRKPEMPEGAANIVRTPHCLRAMTSLSPGATPAAANFEPVDCGGRRAAAAFRFDRAWRLTRVARAIAPGEIVPGYPEFGSDRVQPGQRLSLVVASGPVRIERQVEALQPARPGQRLFVRSVNGELLSVRYGGGAR